MALTVLHLKILITFCFLIMTFGFGMIPVIFRRFIKKISNKQSDQESRRHNQAPRRDVSKYKRIMSLLSCFAGGVFLATCFLDLLPNVRKRLINVMFVDGISTGFPFAEFVMVIGLFIILLIENFVLVIKERVYDGQNQENETTSSQIENPHASIFIVRNEPPGRGPSSCLEYDNPDSRSRSPQNVTQEQNQRRNSGQNSSNSRVQYDDHLGSKSPADDSLQTHSTLRAMLFLFALSLHAIFEGLTVGLLTETSQILNVFAALTIHKSLLSFALGMNLIQTKISIASAIKSVLIFSVAAPVGVIIGIAITDWASSNSGLVHGILQGIASGTFLYIIFFEILPNEFNNEVDRILKVLLIILGYATITAVLFLGDDVQKPFCKPINNGE